MKKMCNENPNQEVNEKENKSQEGQSTSRVNEHVKAKLRKYRNYSVNMT